MGKKDRSLSKISKSTRVTILEIIHRSGASHIGSCFSLVEILNAVYRSVDIDKIKRHCDDRDRVIVSKGHSAAALYTILFKFGLMSKSDLDTYHTNNSLLSGQVSHFIPYVEHSTGALGHGLSVAIGICIGLKSKNISSSRVYVIVGDGELHEGSNWEALMLAGHLKLDNLCVLIDSNNFSAVAKLDASCSIEPYRDKFKSFGFAGFEVDGHNEEDIYSIIQQTKGIGKPVGLICRTTKGKGVSFMENNNIWHYRPPNKEEYKKALSDLKEEIL